MVEYVSMRIMLYNLPFEFWDMDTLQVIGNKLGKFKNAGEGVENKDYSMYSRICISRSMEAPLPEEIELCTSAGVWKQMIVVEEMVDRCSICKAFGHTDLEYNKDGKGKLGVTEAYLTKVIEMASKHGEEVPARGQNVEREIKGIQMGLQTENHCLHCSNDNWGY